MTMDEMMLFTAVTLFVMVIVFTPVLVIGLH